MPSILHQIIKKQIEKRVGDRTLPDRYTRRVVRLFQLEALHRIKGYLFILLGICAAGFGLKGFLLPNGFIDGGVTGISLLVERLTGIPLSFLLVAINLPFVVLGSRSIGRAFAIRSMAAIVMLSVAVHAIPYPVITEDHLLIAIFGGFFLGLGIGLAIRGGSVIDGTEILAVFLTRKSSLTIGDIILIFNIVIFSFGAYILSVETALYAILTYLSASKTVDYVIDGIEEYIGVTIISNRSEEVRLAIVEKLGRGCTIYNGKRGFGKRGDRLADTDIIFSVITRLELSKLRNEIEKVDADAFVVMHSVKDTRGGMIKKRPLAH